MTGVQVVNGVLMGVGTVTGNLLNAAGNVIGSLNQAPITSPLQVTATCTILDLTLGPLDLIFWDCGSS